VQPELKSALMNLPDQSLPTTIIVRPRRQLTPEQLRLLSNELSARPGVDQVSAHIDWFTRVQQARDAGSLLLKRLALSLCAAAAVLIGVLLRDSLLAYRDDTILRGAHGNRGSLICLGALLGFGGSAVAWALQATISLALAQPMSAFWLAIGINTQMPPMPHSSTLLLFFMLSAVVGATIALLLTFSRPAATGKQGPKTS
jgi:cell division protein FtsX